MLLPGPFNSFLGLPGPLQRLELESKVRTHATISRASRGTGMAKKKERKQERRRRKARGRSSSGTLMSKSGDPHLAARKKSFAQLLQTARGSKSIR